MDLLELTPIRDRKIGEPGAADGLAPGQRKILTMGVELVSNCPILFLGEWGGREGRGGGERVQGSSCRTSSPPCPHPPSDEPTSGLDARNALMVMRVVRNVANTGRTVITTIHQPSKELFFMFDNLLLLQRGGWQVRGGGWVASPPIVESRAPSTRCRSSSGRSATTRLSSCTTCTRARAARSACRPT